MAKSNDGGSNPPTNKRKPKSKAGRELSLPHRIQNIDDAVRKKIIEEKKDELAVTAENIAREMAARMDLEITGPLTQLQNEAALLYANGHNIEEVSNKLGIMNVTFEGWLKVPAFAKKINEYIYSEGLVDKAERVRVAKRRLKKLNDAFFEKIDDIDQLSVTTLSKMILEHNRELSELVDTKVDNTKKDISILIVNHYKSQGKQYSDIDDLLNDPEFNFPVIDAEFTDER
jgi:hypothetical protein